MSTSNTAIEAERPAGQQPRTSPMNVSQDSEAIPEIADIRAELHAFAVEMTHEIAAIQALLSGAPSPSVEPAPPAAHREEPEFDQAKEPPTSQKHSAESVEIPAPVGRVTPSSATDQNSLEDSPRLNIQDSPPMSPSVAKKSAANEVAREEPADQKPNTTHTHGQDRLSALKKRLAEKLEAEGLR